MNVVAIGLECGDIYIHNLKFDETLMKFSQDWGAVTGITFRTGKLCCLSKISLVCVLKPVPYFLFCLLLSTVTNKTISYLCFIFSKKISKIIQFENFIFLFLLPILFLLKYIRKMITFMLIL